LARSYKLRGDATKAGDFESKRQEELRLERQTTEELIKQEEVLSRTAKTEGERQEHLRSYQDLQRGIAGIQADQSENLYDDELRFAHLQEILERQKGVVSDISESLSGLGLSQRLEEIISLPQKIAASQGIINSLNPSSPYYSMDVEDLSRPLRMLEARQAYLNSDAGRYHTSQLQANAMATHYNATDINAHGLGLSAGERELDKQKWIAAEINTLAEKRNKDQFDLIRGAQLYAALKESELRLQDRILKNEQERKQVMIESQREFQKTLITAGPGDILRKMAVAQLGAKGFNAGSFFAMSGEARADAFQMMGGDHMAQLNAEAQAIGGRKLTARGLASIGQSLDGRASEYGSALVKAMADGASKVHIEMTGAVRAAESIKQIMLQTAAEIGRQGARSQGASSAELPPQAQGMVAARGAGGGAHTYQPGENGGTLPFALSQTVGF
jgi:hypothetical protein